MLPHHFLVGVASELKLQTIPAVEHSSTPAASAPSEAAGVEEFGSLELGWRRVAGSALFKDFVSNQSDTCRDGSAGYVSRAVFKCPISILFRAEIGPSVSQSSVSNDGKSHLLEL